PSRVPKQDRCIQARRGEGAAIRRQGEASHVRLAGGAEQRAGGDLVKVYAFGCADGDHFAVGGESGARAGKMAEEFALAQVPEENRAVVFQGGGLPAGRDDHGRDLVERITRSAEVTTKAAEAAAKSSATTAKTAATEGTAAEHAQAAAV